MTKILFESEDISSDIKSNGELSNSVIRQLGRSELFFALPFKWALQYQDIVTASVLRISTSEKHQILLNDPKYLLRALQLWTRKYAILRCYLKQMDKDDITSLAYTSFGSKLSVEQIMEQVEIYETVKEWLKHRPCDNTEIARTGRLIRFHYEDKETQNKVPWWNNEYAYQMSGRHDTFHRPFWRLVLLKNHNLNEFILIIPLHHSIVDGVSAKHIVDDFINFWLTELNHQLKDDHDIKDQFDERYKNQEVEKLVNSIDSLLKLSTNSQFKEQRIPQEDLLSRKKTYSFDQMRNQEIPVNSGSPTFMSTFINEDIMQVVMKKVKKEQCRATAAISTTVALAWRTTCKQMNYMIDEKVITMIPLNFTNSVKGLKANYPFPRAASTVEEDETGLIELPAIKEEKLKFWETARKVRKDFENILNKKQNFEQLLKWKVNVLTNFNFTDDWDYPVDKYRCHYCISNVGNFENYSTESNFFVNEQFYFTSGIIEGALFGIANNNNKLCFGFGYDSRVISEQFMLKFIDNLHEIFRSNIFH